MSLVETDWLENNKDKVKIIDCSWHMPQTKRNGFEEYKTQHIPESIFFDLDDNSDKNTNLPHMLVNKNEWEKIVSKMGIKNEDMIIIYDNSDVVSSCRCWFNFIYYGHDPKLVHVLNGGLKKWLEEKRKVTNNISKVMKSDYKSFENQELVKNKFLEEDLSKLNLNKNIGTFFKSKINNLLKSRLGARSEEQILDCYFVDAFTLENGLLTQTLKQKRKEIEKKYSLQIENMYENKFSKKI